MNTGGMGKRWRPAEVGITLIIGSAVGAVLWSLTGLLAQWGWRGTTEQCQLVADRLGQKVVERSQWFPLKTVCEAGGQQFSLTPGAVTILWTVAAVVLAVAAAAGVALLIYSAAVQASRIFRRLQQRRSR